MRKRIFFLMVALLVGALSLSSYGATDGNTVDVTVTNYTHSAMSVSKNGQWTKQWGDNAQYVNTGDIGYGVHNMEVVTLGGDNFTHPTGYSASYDVFRDGQYQGTCNMKFAINPADSNDVANSEITLGCSSAKGDNLPSITYSLDSNTFSNGGTINFTISG